MKPFFQEGRRSWFWGRYLEERHQPACVRTQNWRLWFYFCLWATNVVLFYLVISTTSSSRNSSTGKVKPGMWIIGQLSKGFGNRGRDRWWGGNQLIHRWTNYLVFLQNITCNLPLVFNGAYQSTWRTSLRWAWHSWGWPSGRLERWAGPSQLSTRHQNADFSHESRPKPSGWCWTTFCQDGKRN